MMYDGRMLINDNEWSAECVLQLIESPFWREIGQMIQNQTKCERRVRAMAFIQSNRKRFMSHLNLLSYERPA